MSNSNLSAGRKKIGSSLKQQGGLIILTVIAALVYNYFFISRAYVEIDCTSDHETSVELLWANAGEKYSRSNMGREHLKKGNTQLGFFISDLRKIRHLRLDPMGRRGGTVTFRKIQITQPGMRPVIFENEEDFQQFMVGTDISDRSFSADTGWTVRSDGGNPNLHLVLNPPGERSLNIPVQGGRFLALLFLLCLLMKAFAPLMDDFSYVAVLATGVVLLVAVMAQTTRYGRHPDEAVHAAAAAYYEDHWLMPAVESAEIAPTYSVYGFSRLNSTEISYFIAGKFARLLDTFHLPSYQRYRFFNVLLLCVLVLLTFQSLTARLMFIPLLMTPQAWYIFSYYNSDALALFLVMLTVYQLADGNSLFNRFLDSRTGFWKALPLLGVLAGCLLLIKKNFYFFLIFAVLYLMTSFALKRYPFSWAAMKKILVISLVGLALFGIRYGADMRVNGPDKAGKIQELREQRAGYMYKPSTDLHKQHPQLYLRSRGVSLENFLNKYRWGGKVIRSFYGVYGHMTVSGTTSYYNLMRNTGFLFLGFLFLTVLVKGNGEERILLLNLTICSLALVAAACYTSWINDLQAQGRYMMVILPMLGMLIAKTEQLFFPLPLRSFIAFMFMMSLYNFIFVGIASPLL